MDARTLALLILAALLWGALLGRWHVLLSDRLEARRRVAVSRGETPPDVTGVSGHERAEIMEAMHRAALQTPAERVATVALWTLPPLATLGALWWSG